jgi:single-stranded DNA-binding protein
METKFGKRFHTNAITMQGNLTKDCRYLPPKENLAASCSLSVAVQNGDKTQFVQVRFSENAENLHTQLTKGSFVEFSGQLKDFKGVVREDGTQTYYKGILANHVRVIKQKE